MSSIRVRRREIFAVGEIHPGSIDGGSAGYVENSIVDVLGQSQSNPVPRRGPRKGGAFFCVHFGLDHGTGSSLTAKLGFDDQNPFRGTWYSMGVSPAPTRSAGSEALIAAASNLKITEFLSLIDYGAKGFAATRPGNPEADLLSMLYELLDDLSSKASGAFLDILTGAGGFRKLFNDIRGVLSKLLQEFPDDRKFSPRKADSFLKSPQALQNLPGKYLNWKFGFLPFVSDCQKLYQLSQVLEKRLNQLIRENGKVIRRRKTLDREDHTERSQEHFGYPYARVYGAPPTWMEGSTQWWSVTHTDRRVWHSSTYWYWLPDTGSRWKDRAARALFGANPTPLALWNAMPWSWLSDWFSGWDDVMSNLSWNAVDNLVTLDAYTMAQTNHWTEYSSFVKHEAADDGYRRWPHVAHTFSTKVSINVKARVIAGPAYLPGLSFRPTPGQAAILGAILLTR